MKRLTLVLGLLTSMWGCSDGDTLDASAVPDSGIQNPGDGGDSDSGSDSGVADTDGGTPDTGGRPDSGIVSSAETIPIGTVTLGADGNSDTIMFDLPDGVSTFMVVVDGDDDFTFGIARLEGPTGVLVSDEPVMLEPLEQLFVGPFPSQFKSPNRVVGDEGIAAATFPNNPGVMITGGSYSLKVLGASLGQQGAVPYQGDVEVTIHYKTGDLQTGQIDIAIHFSGAGGITAASAPNDMLIQDALMGLRTIYGTAGITIGNVSYFDIDPSFQTIMSLQGPGNDLNEMFKLSEGRGAGLHYFMVDRIMSPIPIGKIGGVAGGLPGPPLRPGTVASGVAVALASTMNNPDSLAHVMAHEGGHWLGLFHTTEFGNIVQDQLDDTPEGDAGNTHLMFPSVGGGQMISPAQATVMRGHIEVINP